MAQMAVRVLHVVTVCSPDMAFGGPLRVALNLCQELQRRGLTPLLAGGANGYDDGPPANVEGTNAALTPVRTILPGAGFSGLGSVRLLLRLIKLIGGADIVHVHVSRDLVTMPAAAIALLLRKPLVLHCHGMITPSTRRSAVLYDSLLTRAVLRRADRVLVLTPPERTTVEVVARTVLPQLDVLVNGVDTPMGRPDRSEQLVLFAARLAVRKRPEAFVAMAELVREAVPDATFVLIGPDEGCATAVRKLIAGESYISYLGPLPHDEVLDWMARAAVYVLPAVDEPFGLTVAEAMSVGTPVVVTDSCGAGEQVRAGDAGLVVGRTAPELAAAVIELLTDRTTRLVRGRNATRVAQQMFSLTAMGDQVEAIYAAVGSQYPTPQEQPC